MINWIRFESSERTERFPINKNISIHGIRSTRSQCYHQCGALYNMRYDTIRWDSLLLLLDASYSHERPSLPFDLFECADIMKVTVTVIIAIIIIIRHSDCNHKLSKINLRKAKLNDPNTLYYCIICNDLDSQCGQNSDHKMRNDILYCGTVGAYLLVFKWESLIEACRYYDDATK